MPDTPPLKPTFAAILPTSPAALLSAPRNWPLTWIVLVTGLLMTLAATLTLKSSLDRLAERDFVSHYGDIQDKITQRLDDHARLLQAGAGLFNASETVSREQWRLFSQAQNLAQELPGIQGIGFSLLIPWAELPRHLQGIRSEGFPDYSVKPEGDRELYSSIIYLEPFSGRNLRAFGYDMLTEPVRRAAMEQARDTNTVALSGKVVLVQETKSEVQAGTLMYLPIYRKGLAQGTVEQRRAAILGFVYSPYRMNDLLQGILGSRTLEQENHLHLQVFDGEQASSQSLLYACHSAEEEKLWPEPRFSRQLLVDFHGHAWTLRFSQTGGGLFTVEYLGVWLIMTCGMIITGLLFVLIKNLLTSRATIRRSAEALSESVAQLAREQQIILDTMPIGASFLKNRQVQVTNPAHDLIFGYEPGSIKGMDTAAFYADSESYQRLGQEAYAVLASGEIYTTEMVMKKKDGSHFFAA